MTVQKVRLGDILINSGKITGAQLEEALRLQKKGAQFVDNPQE